MVLTPTLLPASLHCQHPLWYLLVLNYPMVLTPTLLPASLHCQHPLWHPLWHPLCICMNKYNCTTHCFATDMLLPICRCKHSYYPADTCAHIRFICTLPTVVYHHCTDTQEFSIIIIITMVPLFQDVYLTCTLLAAAASSSLCRTLTPAQCRFECFNPWWMWFHGLLIVAPHPGTWQRNCLHVCK